MILQFALCVCLNSQVLPHFHDKKLCRKNSCSIRIVLQGVINKSRYWEWYLKTAVVSTDSKRRFLTPNRHSWFHNHLEEIQGPHFVRWCLVSHLYHGVIWWKLIHYFTWRKFFMILKQLFVSKKRTYIQHTSSYVLLFLDCFHKL